LTLTALIGAKLRKSSAIDHAHAAITADQKSGIDESAHAALKRRQGDGEQFGQFRLDREIQPSPFPRESASMINLSAKRLSLEAMARLLTRRSASPTFS
jgi:hypothetical protein